MKKMALMRMAKKKWLEMAGMKMALEMAKGGTTRKTNWMMSLSKRWKRHVKREKWKKRLLKCE